ncbi:MOSC domain-containing protein 1, mitochondrial [Aspergillus udagawae]|uniref:MOSC domain-containing protein 1, mitochondrial n=1 Tax=Aspergillus udagawae TaxID=91492 RepID=A0A8H3PED7_9EURO|nr:MOSC domain-containing protein 1, mitochondrial [Aspergillus udagawae]
MHISQLYTYPIKSLRGVSLSEATLTRTGFQYDRRFMLLKVIPGQNGACTLKNMHVPHFPEMALFTTEIVYPDEEKDVPGRIIVTYHPPADSHLDNKDKATKTLEIPLQPDIRGLRQLSIEMHRSPTTGYDMGDPYNEWFSERFGYGVVLAYLGPHSRRVLGSFAPGKSPAHAVDRPVVSTRSLVGLAVLTLVLNGVRVSSGASASGPVQSAREELLRHWPGVAATVVAGLLSWVLLRGLSTAKEDESITFADTAPYLLTSETSLDELSARFAGDERMDMTKFRPNIVVSGPATAFEEDFWAELRVGQSEAAARLLLTANCVRCRSINVDYATGKMGTGETGSALKKLMNDRRVDKGVKYNPVFGRYVFLDPASDKVMIRVGDEVDVLRTMKERTIYGQLAGSDELNKASEEFGSAVHVMVA